MNRMHFNHIDLSIFLMCFTPYSHFNPVSLCHEGLQSLSSSLALFIIISFLKQVSEPLRLLGNPVVEAVACSADGNGFDSQSVNFNGRCVK